MTTASRPGGRSARTKAAAFRAAAGLLTERGYGAISMTDIAERAGVAATSLYRRWGDVRTLLMEVAVEQLIADAPLPDTGALREDLSAWAISIAAGLRQPRGSAFFRVLIATATPGGAPDGARVTALGPRLAQVATLLDRARARGEVAPPIMDVMDHILAPLYTRALFGVPADTAIARQLVERLLAVRAQDE